MRLLPFVAALVASVTALPATEWSLQHRAHDGALVAKPGPVKDMIVSKETTINGTHKGPTVVVPPGDMSVDQIPLPLSFINNFGGSINAYLTGRCPNGAVCFIRGDGSVVYPSSGGSGVPVPIDGNSIKIPIGAGQTLNMKLPFALNSARIYFAAGELRFGMVATPVGDGLVQPAPDNASDPSAGVNWGFVELNVDPNGTIYANVSYVDFVGMVLGIQLEDNNGPTQTARGLESGSVNRVCDDLRAQASRDGWPWGGQCMTNGNGQVVRVLSPNAYAGVNPNGFANYWTGYVDQVWSRYSSNPLYTRTRWGDIPCRTSGNTMTCQGGDNLVYNKPSARDIWGCNGGPFANTGNDVHKANLAILCAAFHRSTLLLNGGNIQPNLPKSSYYTVDPTNHYSQSVHRHELDGRGYAFPYDDVNAGGENESGTVSSGNPRLFRVWIGGN